jgi:hypothetical protein
MDRIVKKKEAKSLGMQRGKKINAHRTFVGKPLVLYPIRRLRKTYKMRLMSVFHKNGRWVEVVRDYVQ